MKPKHALIMGIILLLALPQSAWSQGKGRIQLQSIAQVEQVTVTADGRKEIQRVPAAKVIPGTEVIFTLFYRNISKETAENAVITNPVPEHMLYREGSAKGQGTAISFSVDHGQDFNIPGKLFIRDTAGRTFPARAKDYTHIRWTFAHPLPSGAEGEVSFRAILE